MSEERKKNNSLNFKLDDPFGLRGRVITKVETQLGYLQVLEYTLHDWNYLHVVQWHFNNDIENGTLIPKMNCLTFYKEKDKALETAHEIGNNLLAQN